MTRRRTSLLLTLAAAGLLPAAARGDDAMVIGRQERPPILSLDPFRGSIGVMGIYSAQNNSTRGQTSSASNMLFSENLSLADSGRIFSSNFMTWTAVGTVSLQEQQSDTGTTHDSQFGVFDTYDVHADIFKYSPFPITAHATQSETYIDRAFAAMLRNTTTSYGGTVRYDSPTLPTTLTIGHTSVTQSDLGGAVQYSSDTDQVSLQSSFQPLPRQQVTLNYDFSNNSQNNPGILTNDFVSQHFSVSHVWGIDPDGRYTLSQAAGYNDQTGLFPSHTLFATESLAAHFTESLHGQLDYRFNHDNTTQEEFQAAPTTTSDLTSHYIQASLTHQLYNSLTTGARFGGSMTDDHFDSTNVSQRGDSSTHGYFGNIGTNYTKKVWLGQFGANVSLGYDVSDNSEVGATQTVTNQPATFNDPQPIVLTRPGVEANTVRVFDATGIRELVNGIDYTVRQVGNTVQINRIVGGDIDNGDTVRLRYDIEPLSAYTSTTTSFGTGANYLFQEGPLTGLNLYTRYFQSDQSISSNTNQIRPDNVRDLIAGATYSIWKLQFNGEAEKRDSTLAPFDAQRFSARYSDMLDQRTTLSLDASQSFVQYPQDNSTTSLTAAGGQLLYQITRDLNSRIMVRWRDENDSRLGNLMGIEEQARLEWKVRQTNMYLMIRHTNLDSYGGSNESLFFQFGVTRTF